MSETDILKVVRAAMARASAAMEAAEEAKVDVVKLRTEFEKFVRELPSELTELGVLLLSREQMDYLLGQIGVAMAERVLAKARDRKERWWDRRWVRWSAYVAVAALLLNVVMNALQVMGWTR